MQASAEQVRWIPIEMITQEEANASQGDVVMLRTKEDGGYLLLSGGDKLRRMQQAGQTCVDAVVDPDGRMEEKLDRLLDRLARGTIHYLDEAKAYQDLLQGGLSVDMLSERIGRTPATVRRKLRLLNLSKEAQTILRQSGLREGCAHEILRVPGQQGRLRVLRHASQGGLGMKETEKLVDDVLARMPVPITTGRRMKPLMRDYRLYLNAIRGIVEQMCDAGLEANMNINVGKYVAEVRITVPIFAQKR